MGWWFFNSDDVKKNDNKQNEQIRPLSPNNYEIHQNFSSYSSSKSCHTDPQDPAYLICTQKINDGKNIQTKQTKVHASQQQFGPMSSMFSSFFRGIDQTENILQSRSNQLQKQFSQDFEKIIGGFMPFFMMFDPQAIKKFEQNSRNFQKQFPDSQQYVNSSTQTPNQYKNTKYKGNNKQNHSNKYFTSTSKDFQIRDL